MTTPSGESRASELRISLTEARTLIPDYDGNTEELHRFISCCDLLFSQAKSDADRKMFLSILKTKLSGAAYDILRYKDIPSWEDLKCELKAQFQEHRPRIAIQGELIRLRQGLRETVPEFACRIHKQLADLNSVTFNEATDQASRNYLLSENERNAIRTFEDGLRNEQLKVIVKARSETSLRKLITFATEHSQRMEDSRTAHPRVTPNSPSCDYCGKRGHLREQCYKRKQLPVMIPQSLVKREVNRVICSYCRKPNHHIRECRKRTRDERQNRQPVSENRPAPSPINSRNFNLASNSNQPRHMRNVRWSMPDAHLQENEYARECSDGELSRELATQAVIH